MFCSAFSAVLTLNFVLLKQELAGRELKSEYRAIDLRTEEVSSVCANLDVLRSIVRNSAVHSPLSFFGCEAIAHFQSALQARRLRSPMQAGSLRSPVSALKSYFLLFRITPRSKDAKDLTQRLGDAEKRIKI